MAAAIALLHIKFKPHLIFFLLIMPLSCPSSSQQVQDLLLLDQVVRDCAFRSYSADHHKTAVVYNVSLPPELSGITASAVRYRAGSLRRYGASFKEFDIAPGVFVHPHSKRLILVTQNLSSLSSAYSGFRNLSGYRIVSPVLGLLFYRETKLQNHSNASVGDILVARRPITIKFSDLMTESSQDRRPLCALFEQDGKLSLWNQTRPGVCSTRRQGHFAVVVVEEEEASRGGGEWTRSSPWKLVAAGVAAGMFMAVLLGLVVVAVVAVRRKRLWTAEMERRAYEDEALQVAIVGHVRAPTAAAARTAATLEDDYSPYL